MANFKRPHLYAPKYVLNPPEIPWFPGAWCHDQQIFQTTPHGAARLVQGTHRHTFPDQGKIWFNLHFVGQLHTFDSVRPYGKWGFTGKFDRFSVGPFSDKPTFNQNYTWICRSSVVMWVKQCHKLSPSHHHCNKKGVNHSRMGGLLLFFPHHMIGIAGFNGLVFRKKILGTGKPYIYWENPWFSIKIFLKPIHWWIRLDRHRSPGDC